MSVVTEHIISLIAKQVEDHQLVVWYDPEQVYSSVVDGIKLPKTTVARYQGTFFQLRREIDGLMNGLQPPRLVVYVPLDQAKTDHALVELEAAGVVMQPGQQPPNRNTRLAVVARNALKPILGEETAAQVEKNVDAGKLSLAELDALANKGKGAMGVVSLLFGTVDPQEVALVFLASDKLDKQIEQKTATKELTDLFRRTFELDITESVPLAFVAQQNCPASAQVNCPTTWKEEEEGFLLSK